MGYLRRPLTIKLLHHYILLYHILIHGNLPLLFASKKIASLVNSRLLHLEGIAFLLQKHS